MAGSKTTFPSSSLPVWRGGGKTGLGAIQWMTSQGSRRLTRAGVKDSADLGDYGVTMVTGYWYRALLSGCWQTTVWTKHKGRPAGRWRLTLTTPSPGHSLGVSLRSPQAVGTGWSDGKIPFILPLQKAPPSPCLFRPQADSNVRIRIRDFEFRFPRGPEKWAQERGSPELTLLRTRPKRASKIHVTQRQLPLPGSKLGLRMRLAHAGNVTIFIPLYFWGLFPFCSSSVFGKVHF